MCHGILWVWQLNTVLRAADALKGGKEASQLVVDAEEDYRAKMGVSFAQFFTHWHEEGRKDFDNEDQPEVTTWCWAGGVKSAPGRVMRRG